MSIEANLADVKARVSQAAQSSGRSYADVTIIGVTKTIDTDRISKLLDYGIINLGENRVQELLEKYDIFGDRPTWHLIGHLQTNKVKYIIDKVAMIHSVDSVKLAVEIDKRARAIGRCMDILVEVNIADEMSKFGIRPEDTTDFVEEIKDLKGVCVKGLMCVAPFVEEPWKNRGNFRKMRKLLIDIDSKIGNNVSTPLLSMGMTNDYEVAIEEGSSMVRIGTGIFGKR